MTDRRVPRSGIGPEGAEWLDATRLLLALATGRPMGAYNTVPEAARGVLSYVQRQCAELDAARAEIEQLRAVADTARDIEVPRASRTGDPLVSRNALQFT